MAKSNIRNTDYLPQHFNGDTVDADKTLAHFLAFQDYLEAQDIDSTKSESLPKILNSFKRILAGQARLWFENRTFLDVKDLRNQFLSRFSPSVSHFSHTQAFDSLSYFPGDTAEIHFAKVTKAALLLQYGDLQIKDKFISSLPSDCRAAILMSLPLDAPIASILAKAQCFFDLQADLSTPQHNNNLGASTTDITDICNKIEALEAKFDSRPQPDYDINRSRSDVRPSFGDRRRYHSQDNRRQPRKFSRSNFPDRQSIVCHYCHRSGHMWETCFSRLNNEAARSRQNFQEPQYFGQPQQIYGQYPPRQFVPKFQPRRDNGQFSSQQHFQ